MKNPYDYNSKEMQNLVLNNKYPLFDWSKISEKLEANYNEQISVWARERMAFIIKNREKLLEVWFAETGCLPSESVIVEQPSVEGWIRIYVRYMTEEERKQGHLRPNESKDD